MSTIIKLSSYSSEFPSKNCNVKVAVKIEGWETQDAIKTEVYEDAIYEDGFVTIEKQSYLAANFLFHKLKRKNF